MPRCPLKLDSRLPPTSDHLPSLEDLAQQLLTLRVASHSPAVSGPLDEAEAALEKATLLLARLLKSWRTTAPLFDAKQKGLH
jgi:hypothetical protein